MYSVATVKMTQEREYMLYSKKFGVEHGGRGDKKIDMEQQVQKSAPTNLAKLLEKKLDPDFFVSFNPSCTSMSRTKNTGWWLRSQLSFGCHHR